jgi:hypothetical protein
MALPDFRRSNLRYKLIRCHYYTARLNHSGVSVPSGVMKMVRLNSKGSSHDNITIACGGEELSLPNDPGPNHGSVTTSGGTEVPLPNSTIYKMHLSPGMTLSNFRLNSFELFIPHRQS